jgi:hypothetical protein
MKWGLVLFCLTAIAVLNSCEKCYKCDSFTVAPHKIDTSYIHGIAASGWRPIGAIPHALNIKTITMAAIARLSAPRSKVLFSV